MADVNLSNGTVTDGGGSRTWSNPANVNDNDINTVAGVASFAAGAGTYTAYLKTNLGQPFVVSEHRVRGDESGSPIAWTGISRSDNGSSWTPLSISIANFGGIGTVTHSAATAQYWRLEHTRIHTGLQFAGWVNTRTWDIQGTAAAAGTITADFSGTPLVGVSPLAVAFTDLTDGDPQTWRWDFGDGTILEYGLGDPPSGADTFELTTIISAATAVGTAYVKLTEGAGTTPAQPIAIPTPAGTAYFVDWVDDGSYGHLDAVGTAYSDLGEASELEGVIRELPADIGAGAAIASRVAVMLTSGGTISRLMAGGPDFGVPNFTED